MTKLKDVLDLQRRALRMLEEYVSEQQSSEAKPKMNIGTNLGEVRHYSPNWPFENIFKTAKPWVSGSSSVWDDTRPLDLNSSGYVRSLTPGQVARTRMLCHEPVFPAGRYHVYYDGEGTIKYTVNRVVSSAPGHDVLSVIPTRLGITLTITATNPDNYIRNIRVYAPVNESLWSTFNPQFLESLHGYKTIRFMDWQRTNNSPVRSWSDCADPADATYTKQAGVPLEVMCELANILNVNPWFCIPHMADNYYVAKFAATVRNRVNPHLKVHIEYSNEVWNGAFAQFAYCRERGLALGLDAGGNKARAYYYSMRSVEIFRIFEDVFGGTERLVRVMATQAANPGMTKKILGSMNPSNHTDALAIAPYFGGYLGKPINMSELSDLFMELEMVAVPKAIKTMEAQAALAAEHGMKLIAYEGGQHLVGKGEARNDERLNALFDAANRDPRMEQLYTKYLEAWKIVTDGVFCHYTDIGPYTKYGRWGSMEYLGQPLSETPKRRALLKAIGR